MGDWKLLLNAMEQNADETSAAGDKAGAKVELYNLAEDVSESKDLAASQPEKVTQMRTRLDALLKGAVSPGRRRDKTPSPRSWRSGYHTVILN